MARVNGKGCAASIPLFSCIGLPISALIIGSLAPDFPYFLQLSTSNQFAHSLTGILLFCVPAGLFALWLWHRGLVVPLRSLLPISTQQKMPRASKAFSFWPTKQLLLIICALMVGALTHIVWDSFTHANGFVIRQSSLLRAPLLVTPHGTLFVFKFLQHSSSLLGALALAWLFRRAMRNNFDGANAQKTNAHLVIPLISFAAVIAILKTFAISSDSTLHTQIRDFVLSFVATLWVVLTIWSVCWHWRQRRFQA